MPERFFCRHYPWPFGEENNVRGTIIYGGLSPYFAFDILYDPANAPVDQLAAPN